MLLHSYCSNSQRFSEQIFCYIIESSHKTCQVLFEYAPKRNSWFLHGVCFGSQDLGSGTIATFRGCISVASARKDSLTHSYSLRTEKQHHPCSHHGQWPHLFQAKVCEADHSCQSIEQKPRAGPRPLWRWSFKPYNPTPLKKKIACPARALRC